MQKALDSETVSRIDKDLSCLLVVNSGLVLCEAHLLCKGGVRDPLGGSTGSGLLHEFVDLLKSETLGLVDEEVGVDEAADAEGTPEPEDLCAEVGLVGTDEVRGDDCDDAVPEPVGSGREGNTTRTDGEREDFADDDPSSGTPGGSEEEDVDLKVSRWLR